MLQGKIIYDKDIHHDRRHNYIVQVGGVTIDISADVRSIVSEFAQKQHADYEQQIADLKAQHTEVLKRYSEIERIVLAGGTGMPTG